MIIRTVATLVLLFLVSFATVHAQTGGDITGSNVTEYLTSITGFIYAVLVPLVYAVAFVTFIWGVFLYLIAGGANEEKRDQGKQLIVWGIVGFFVMVSVWGLVNVLRGTFQFGDNSRPTLPIFDPARPSSTAP